MTTPNASTLMPCLRYRDARAAIAWLGKAFGFREHAVHADDNDGIEHAELVLGRGMVMLGSVRDNDYGSQVLQPDEASGRNTQSIYVVVADCRAHYERACAAGAEIVLDYEEKDYGGAGYTCRDPEGHLWSFGSYDPWAA
ncbi:VOC family protein [Oleiagrimonas soli]|uniref:Glyoxalase n=1 Tax=Oleiagrimonas soli TaxID=1543381 RepID=A0A099CVR6_9GAMM|nr:VOC family protein [Oleiagrimonas soli]KGI77722.1 glyoxalase [Oleiagrimonas soli]MBB6182847.1 putative glyoxalase superfamily protein PhnB [Oleiagrimonas soli]